MTLKLGREERESRSSIFAFNGGEREFERERRWKGVSPSPKQISFFPPVYTFFCTLSEEIGPRARPVGRSATWGARPQGELSHRGSSATWGARPHGELGHMGHSATWKLGHMELGHFSFLLSPTLHF